MAKVLLGFMGVGKSSVAPYLNGRFVDMDQVIEDKIGMSITDFFAKEGEASFRQIESETLEELLQEGDDVIISTGGGVVVTECNRKLLKKNRKHNVWLHSSFDVVYNRIKRISKINAPSFSIILKRNSRPFMMVEWPSIKVWQIWLSLLIIGRQKK